MIYQYRDVFIYADTGNNLFIIPTGESKRLYGATMEIDILNHLTSPYTDIELEEVLMNSMDLCFSKEPNDAPGAQSAMEKFLGVKGYSKAVKNKRCIRFHWDIDDGYSITPTRKVPKEGYISMKDKRKYIGHRFENGKLAFAIREAMQISMP